MSDRFASRASWLAFAAFTAILYAVSSCSGDSDSGTSDIRPTETDSSSPPSTADAETEAGVAPDTGVDPDAAADPVSAEIPPSGNPELLSEWNQLDVGDGRLVAREGVTPYSLNSTLFSDHAHKLRTVWLPDDAPAAAYDADDTFDFPVGTVITKTFYYPVPDGAGAADPTVLETDQEDARPAAPLNLDEVRLVETRVLVHREEGWEAFPYVWNEDETEATLQRTGDLIQLAVMLDDSDTETPLNYVVPDANQCASCHAVNHSTGEIQPIGPKARHLNREVDPGDGPVSQLDHWRDVGLLEMLPDAADVPSAAVWNDASASVDDRARAYLDVNCAHCHNPLGPADTSGLILGPDVEVGLPLGICKPPVAAGTGTGGRSVDIAPGEPDESIMVHRMESTDPSSMMPELGRTLAHTEGVDLISEWIESLPGQC